MIIQDNSSLKSGESGLKLVNCNVIHKIKRANKENPAVIMDISEKAKKLNDSQKNIGNATEKLNDMDENEKVRKEKLEKINSLKKELENEDLTDADRKCIEDDIEKLTQEAKTNRDRINDLKSEMYKMQEERPSCSVVGYVKLIDDLEQKEKEHQKNKMDLMSVSRQEKADAYVAEMKEADKTKYEVENQISGVQNIAIINEESENMMGKILTSMNNEAENSDSSTIKNVNKEKERQSIDFKDNLEKED